MVSNLVKLPKKLTVSSLAKTIGRTNSILVATCLYLCRLACTIIIQKPKTVPIFWYKGFFKPFDKKKVGRQNPQKQHNQLVINSFSVDFFSYFLLAPSSTLPVRMGKKAARSESRSERP